MTPAYSSRFSAEQVRPVLTVDNVEEFFNCLTIEEMAERIAGGGRPDAHPKGVFRFKDVETMSKVDAMTGARLAEYLKVYGEPERRGTSTQ